MLPDLSRHDRTPEPSLADLGRRYIGRIIVDRDGRRLGVVRDLFLTPREKTPLYLSCERSWRLWRPWRPHDRFFAYPLSELRSVDEEPLVALRPASAIVRGLDYRPDFLASYHAKGFLSLIDYLDASDMAPAYTGA